jgi:hypothetical protein
MARRNRRWFLTTTGQVAVGSAAAVALGSGKAGAATTTTPAVDVTFAEVSAVSAGAVQVSGASGWYVIEGFPEGWGLLVGDQVALAQSVENPVGDQTAQPSVHWDEVTATPASLQPGTSLDAQNESPEVVTETVFSPDLEALRDSGSTTPVGLLASVVDRGPSDGSLRVIALRMS